MTRAVVDFHLVYSQKSSFEAGQNLFRRYEGLSMGDATIASYMLNNNIEYVYSFDDDFDAVEGVTRLNVADNPFE